MRLERTNMKRIIAFAIFVSFAAASPLARAQGDEQKAEAKKILPRTAFALSSQLRSGERALSHDDNAKAKEFFERALQKNPDSVFAKIGLGQALYELGRYED